MLWPRIIIVSAIKNLVHRNNPVCKVIVIASHSFKRLSVLPPLEVNPHFYPLRGLNFHQQTPHIRRYQLFLPFWEILVNVVVFSLKFMGCLYHHPDRPHRTVLQDFSDSLEQGAEEGQLRL
jgi:hypothetical protein